jgi:hypothetical protein
MKRGFEPIIVGLVGCSALILFMVSVGFLAAFGFFAGGNKNLGSNTSGYDTDDKRKDITPKEWEQIFRAAEAKVGTPWEVSAAIVYNESGGGRNFGGCSYYPPAPASGHVLTEGNGLRSTEDKLAFKAITMLISYPENEPVSCNPKGSNGGAMGYMQIMPREWQGYTKKISVGGVTTGVLNPWNAQDAAYVAAMIIKCKSGGEYCTISAAFPETEKGIKTAAGGYHGSGPTGDYAARVYARYLEFKAAGQITL